jgi:mitogen-activated protein kinase 6
MPTHSFKVYGQSFHVDAKYSPIKPLGRGAYGIVVAALNRDTGRKVAIKRVSPMARTIVDAKHTLREIRLMRLLGRHRNVYFSSYLHGVI